MRTNKITGLVAILAGISGLASATLYMDNGLESADPNFMSVTLGDEGGGYAQDGLRLVAATWAASSSISNIRCSRNCPGWAHRLRFQQYDRIQKR